MKVSVAGAVLLALVLASPAGATPIPVSSTIGDTGLAVITSGSGTVGISNGPSDWTTQSNASHTIAFGGGPTVAFPLNFDVDVANVGPVTVDVFAALTSIPFVASEYTIAADGTLGAPSAITDSYDRYWAAVAALNSSPPVSDVPEPGSLALFAVGLFGLTVLRKRRAT